MRRDVHQAYLHIVSLSMALMQPECIALVLYGADNAGLAPENSMLTGQGSGARQAASLAEWLMPVVKPALQISASSCTGIGLQTRVKRGMPSPRSRRMWTRSFSGCGSARTATPTMLQ